MDSRPMTAIPRIRFALGASLCAALLSLAACSGDDSFTPGVPTQIAIADSAFAFTALGQNHQFTAAVKDGHGDPVTTDLVWSTSDPTVLKINGDGLATAAAIGTATITVSAGPLSARGTI